MDFSDFLQDDVHTRVGSNYFQLSTTAISNLLMASPLSITPEGVIDSRIIRHVMSDLLINELRYGGAVMVSGVDTDGDPYITSIDPLCWYPRRDGGFFIVKPYTSDEATSELADRIEVTIAEPDGEAYKTTYEFSGSSFGKETVGMSIGERLDEPEYDGLAFQTVMHNHPEVPGWGTSRFDRMISNALELNVRQTQLSHIFNAHLDPSLIIVANREDLNRLVTKQDIAYDDADIEKQLSPEKIMVNAIEVVRDMLLQDVTVTSNTVLAWEWKMLTAKFVDALAFIDKVRLQTQIDSGIPPQIYEVGGIPTSGVALKRLMFNLYTESLTLQDDTKAQFEEGLNKIVDSGNIEVHWVNAFDYIDAELSPGPNENSPQTGTPEEGII